MKTIALALTLGSLALLGFGSAGEAAERRASVVAGTAAMHQPTSARYVRKRVHGVGGSRRIGFYSYSYRDVINTYGMSRTLYGSTNTYRAPFMDRQTPSGPFDHGFFFDSGMGLHGGDSPYLH
jgi:hypothetical protein